MVESFKDRRSPLLKRLSPISRGVSDVDAHNRAGMKQTLARIREAAEKSPD